MAAEYRLVSTAIPCSSPYWFTKFPPHDAAPRGVGTALQCHTHQKWPRRMARLPSPTHASSPREPQSLSRNLHMSLMRTTRFIPHLTHVPYASHGVYPQLTHVPCASHGVYPQLTHVPHAGRRVYPATYACSSCEPRGLSRTLRTFLTRATGFIPVVFPPG